MANAHMDEDETMDEGKKFEQPEDGTSNSMKGKSESWNKKGQTKGSRAARYD